jgi:hypothetical protein
MKQLRHNGGIGQEPVFEKKNTEEKEIEHSGGHEQKPLARFAA